MILQADRGLQLSSSDCQRFKVRSASFGRVFLSVYLFVKLFVAVLDGHSGIDITLRLRCNSVNQM